MIDSEGYRANVGIILVNGRGELLWAKRAGQDAWQFPQGGIQRGETPLDALFRELYEELGLPPELVEVLGVTDGWLRYKLPARYIRRRNSRVCIGQKQKWFALRLTAPDSAVRLDATPTPEFDGWRWVKPDHPVTEVVEFKREVYTRALEQLGPLLANLAKIS